MNLAKLLHDNKFNVFFSFILGIGIICVLRPICHGPDCNVSKAPSEKDFDKYVYRLGDKCYEFKTETVDCPTSGVIEAFRECALQQKKSPHSTRTSPILSCD